MRKRDPEKERRIIELAEGGASQKSIADEVGCSIPVVSKVLKAARARAAAKAPPTGKRDAKELRDRLLRTAHRALDHVELQLEQGTIQSQSMVAVGIATQRFLEAEQKLAAVDGLPQRLPDEDGDARNIVLQGWWQQARQGNPNAMQHLAEALGLRRANQQPIRVTFEGDDPEDGSAT